jgi:hypothetical protein
MGAGMLSLYAMSACGAAAAAAAAALVSLVLLNLLLVVLTVPTSWHQLEVCLMQQSLCRFPTLSTVLLTVL